jgi:hypothetical protein
MQHGWAARRLAFVAVVSAAALGGCSENKDHYVIAATGTAIGLDISQNPATQTPQAKLGYHRGELAIVPTDRGTGSDGTGAGAEKSADVLMEIYFGTGLSTTGGSTIYQRLAVGKDAVSQPGAGVMFAKGPTGQLDANAERALMAARGIPAPTINILKTKLDIGDIYSACVAAGKKDDFEDAVKIVHTAGYLDFQTKATSPKTVTKVLENVKKLGC